jgi:glycosyltransferase involved in cell wall biosynthesis
VRCMADIEALPAAERNEVARTARQRIATVYTWERVTGQYEALFRELAAS